MKKIVFVISDMGMGGAQRVVSLLAHALTQQSHCDVSIISMGNAGDRGFFDLPNNVVVHALNVLGVSAGFFPMISGNIKRIASLRSALKSAKPDCVISFQTETNIVCLLAALGTKIPIIVSERSDPYVHPQQKIWRVMRRIAYPLATGAVLQTEYAARFFHYLRNKVVILNPVNISDRVTDEIPHKSYILGVGRLSVEKGFDDLIAAHAIARRNYPDLKLILVGDGPERARLEQQVERLGTGGYVEFAGAQSDLKPYYLSATAFVLPSRFEGLPNALLEAMSYGCAVVSTPLFAAVSEIIAHGWDGLIADGGAPEALAREIEFICGQPDMAFELRKNAKISAQRFLPGPICEVWLDFINSHSR